MLDLSYVNEQEAAMQRAISEACLNSIEKYMSHLADTMETNAIETLNVPTIRAMATEFQTRSAQ